MSGPAESRVVKYTYRGEGRSWFQPVMWKCGWALSRVLAWVFFRLRWYHAERLPRRGPVLLVTNHQSFLDPWLIGIPLWRQVHYMARDTLFSRGFLHWLMETLNAFPVKRGHADRASIRLAAERLDQGRVVNIFPEGTRTADGAIGRIAPGIVLILRSAKVAVPVVPVVIDGAFAAWPRTAPWPRPRKIRLAFGAPIPSQELLTTTPAAAADRIHAAMASLQDELRALGGAGATRR